ncbi:MAG: hypothetical protein ACRDHZ_12160 [Ktedonobacteraceae bacterium]
MTQEEIGLHMGFGKDSARKAVSRLPNPESRLRPATVNPVPGMKVNVFLENSALAPILSRLITISSLPLRAVETEFAPDSNSFSTSRFVR